VCLTDSTPPILSINKHYCTPQSVMMMGCAILCLAISFVLSPEPRSDATIKDAQNTFQKISSGQKEKIHGRLHLSVTKSTQIQTNGRSGTKSQTSLYFQILMSTLRRLTEINSSLLHCDKSRRFGLFPFLVHNCVKPTVLAVTSSICPSPSVPSQAEHFE
jgi:hypothetical protein